MDPLSALQTFCRHHGYNIQDILSRARNAQIVECRRNIAKAMRAMGYTYPQIGSAMQRHHATIIYLCQDDFCERKKAGMREYYMEQEDAAV